jgi:hypothetical protein
MLWLVQGGLWVQAGRRRSCACCIATNNKVEIGPVVVVVVVVVDWIRSDTVQSARTTVDAGDAAYDPSLRLCKRASERARRG